MLAVLLCAVVTGIGLLIVSADGSSAPASAQRLASDSSPATDGIPAFATSRHRLRRNLSYRISTSNCRDRCDNAAAAVGNGFGAWAVSGTSITQSTTPGIDPCTHTPNSVTWAPLAAPQDTLAMSNPCFNPKTGEVLGFQITLNSRQPWSDCLSSASCRGLSSYYSIAAVAAHEGGHLYGLNHAPGRPSSRLTMSPGVSAGDYGHATLGCGDRLGINALYHTNLSCTQLPGD